MMSEADKYRQQGDPQQQNQPQYQDQGQSQNPGDYHNQAQNNQGYNNNNNSGYNPAYNGNQQQQYQQQPANGYQDHPYGPPPPYSFNPPQVHDEKYSFNDAFKLEKPKFNDWWAGILFLAAFGGYVAVSGLSIHGYSKGFAGHGIYDDLNSFSLNSNTIILFAFCLVIAFVFSYVYVWLARLFPKQFIWITGILNLAWALGTAIYYLIKGYWSAGIVFVIFAAFLIFAFFTWIGRIPFSALMLKTSIDVSKKYGHVYLVSLIGGFIATALAAWFSVTLVAIYVSYEPSPDNPRCSVSGNNCSHSKVIGLVAYVTFAMFWISEWLKNTIHTIIAGVYGSWYFSPHNFPKRATRGAAKRALTYSFGSICFGSLIVAFIQFLKQVCSVVRSQAASEGGAAGWIAYAIFCILTCVISIIEWAVQFVNRYAFCHIALYGKAYIASARDTWRMIKDRGIDALVNDCLVGPVLSFGAIFIGYACALFAYLYLLETDPPYNRDGGFTAVIMAYAFLIGFQIGHVFTTPLGSGIDTIFVAAGWDPQVMIRDHPELYHEMVRVYPRVQQAIH
ncbi:Putative choline transporter, neither null mutation nor overexpression affects choline transport [Trichoderma asperellum]|nr:Putative choline transporter, neither null mutation nor overexpression affects choline transport [Trichoderma asperellum]